VAQLRSSSAVGFWSVSGNVAELEDRIVVLDRIRALQDWGPRFGENRSLDLGIQSEASETVLTQDIEIATAASGPPDTFVPGRNFLFWPAAGFVDSGLR